MCNTRLSLPRWTWLAIFALSSVAAPLPAAEFDTTWLQRSMPDLVELYKELHGHPELSFQEKETAKCIAQQLRDLKINVTTGIGGHGLVGILTNGPGKTLLLRTDLDALPIKEETGLRYASKVQVEDPSGGGRVGVMHACGHDVHMTVFVGVARYLTTHPDAWQGTIMFVAQPAEEHLAGARAMLEDGLYRRFGKPDFALALHVAAEYPAGVLGYGKGFVAAASDSVDITLYGKGGHGAAPHLANDPIVQAAELIMSLQTIVAREIDPRHPAVVTVGSIHSGTAHNIIPEQCHLKLTVRSYRPDVRTALLEAIERKATGVSRAMGARKPRVKITRGTEALYNDPALTEQLVPALAQTAGKAQLQITQPGMGSEDFAMYGQDGVPVFLFSLGSAAPNQASKRIPTWPLHNSKYAPDAPPTLRTGITAMTRCVMTLLPRQ